MNNIQQDIRALEIHNLQCNSNIETFSNAIRKENLTIAEYNIWIRSKDTTYNIESLKQGVVQCEHNIEVFNASINGEKDSIKNNNFMITELKRKLHKIQLQKEQDTKKFINEIVH